MANTIATPTRILRECMDSFIASLGLAGAVDRQYDQHFGQSGKKDGSTIYARMPTRGSVGTGRAINVEDEVESTVAITCATQKHVALTFTDLEMAVSTDMEMAAFRKRHIDQKMAQLAATVDSAGFAALNTAVYQNVGTAGTTPSALATYLAAQRKLNEQMAPMTDRSVIFDPAACAASAAIHIALFNPQNKVSDIYNRGYQTSGLGFDWYMDQQVNAITCGSRVGTILTDDAALTYSTEGTTTVHIDGLTNATDTIAAGEVFTISGVYDVNPLTGDAYSHLKQFCVTTAATAASNEVSLTVVPAMYSTGPRKNVSALVADGATVTFLGTASTAYPWNYAIQKSAVTLVTADLELDKGAEWCVRDEFQGIKMRLWRAADIKTGEKYTRVDVLYGWAVLRPEWCVKIIG